MAGTGKAHLRNSPDVILLVEDLLVEFPVGRTGLKVNAVSGISFDVLRGETLGLVGESGCGKSTTGRAVMQLRRPEGGSVVFEDKELTSLPHDELRAARTRMQMIFQDPISSLNPRRKVRDIVMEPLDIWKRGDKAERDTKVDQLLSEVGIDPARAAESQPHQFSGGQCQRISIARSLVLDPQERIRIEVLGHRGVNVAADGDLIHTLRPGDVVEVDVPRRDAGDRVALLRRSPQVVEGAWRRVPAGQQTGRRTGSGFNQQKHQRGEPGTG